MFRVVGRQIGGWHMTKSRHFGQVPSRSLQAEWDVSEEWSQPPVDSKPTYIGKKEACKFRVAVV